MGSQTAAIGLTDADGDTFWRTSEGQIHRDGGPAIEYADGDTFWYQHNLRHRDGAPAVERSDGSKYWYQNDILHRDGGPAEIHTDTLTWFQHGKRHRTDGPALEYTDGRVAWWIDNNELTPADFAAEVLDKDTAMLWKMSGYCWPFDFGADK